MSRYSGLFWNDICHLPVANECPRFSACGSRRYRIHFGLSNRLWPLRHASSSLATNGLRPTDSNYGMSDVPTPVQPPLVPGGPVIRAGGGRNWRYKADTPGASGPLLGAAMGGDPRLLKQLLERGKDVHARIHFGICALTLICSRAALLIASGERGPAMSCAQTMIDVLLEYGADTNVRDGGGRTPAHVCLSDDINTSASIAALEAVLRQLLNAGADLSITDIQGNTPRMSANKGPALQQLFKRLEVEYAEKRKAWTKQMRGR